MVDTKNYKKYIAIGSLMMPNSLVGSFRKKDDDSFTCDIIMNDAKVDEAGFITCATTMFPDKAVIYITKDMLEALQQDDEIALFDLYRELGHIECGHFDVSEDASEMTQEESLEMMDRQDLEADAFAAEFVGKDEALCFATGFTVNSGVISQIVDRNDYVICDDRDHASIVDGRRLSFATQLKYKHNDMEDLEKQLQKCEPDRVKLIVVDGVFSMVGDLCKLPEIVELKKKYNAAIMVDEAHGIGVFGKQGRGVCNHFGLTDDVDLIMGTFSKSLASIGGFIAADSSIINWLRHTARTYIFSASCTPAATAAAREALHIIQQEPERLEALWNVTNYALKRFREEGFEIGDTESPIIPLYVRDTDKTFMAVAKAFNEGVFINPVIPPACAPQDTLVRYALMANHTREQVDESVIKLKKVFKELGII